MSGFLARRSLRRALLSREGLVVLLAFALTAGVYGAVFLSLTSTYRGEPAASRLAAPVTLFFHEGCVWRLSVPLPAGVRGELVSVRLTIRDVELPALFLGFHFTFRAKTVIGSLAMSIASGIMIASGLGLVDLIVYVDPDGRLSVVVDDDLDGLMDDSYLVRFVQGLTSVVEPSLDGDEALSVPRGSDVPLGHLDVVLAASSSPSPTLVVRDGPNEYRLPLVELLRNLKRPVAYLVESEGGRSLVLVLPYGIVGDNSELSLRVDIGGRSLEASIAVPAELPDAGSVTVLAR